MRRQCYVCKRRKPLREFETKGTAASGLKTNRCRLCASQYQTAYRKRFPEALGYVPGNVWIICNKANRIKSNATIDELERIVSGLRAKMSARAA